MFYKLKLYEIKLFLTVKKFEISPISKRLIYTYYRNYEYDKAYDKGIFRYLSGYNTFQGRNLFETDERNINKIYTENIDLFIFYISVCKLTDIVTLNASADCIKYNRPDIIDVCNSFLGDRNYYFQELMLAAEYKNCALLQYFVTTGSSIDIHNILDSLDGTILAKKIERYYSSLIK